MLNVKAVHSAFVQAIKDALGTEEDGAALIEVARNAHKAEQELAMFKRRVRDLQWSLRAAYERLS